jgi:hypothetical protein
MSCFAFFITPYSLLINTGFLATLGMTNKMQNKTATLHVLICQHNLEN